MNADGSDLHKVTAPGGQPAFTPDGDQLVYGCSKCAGRRSGIFLMRDDGSDAPGRRLSTNPFPPEGDTNPEVSPDGQTVTFVRDKADQRLQALYAVDIDGSNVRRLTTYTLEVGIKHDWAPDGEHIVLTPHADYYPNKPPNVATISPDGSDLRMLTDYIGGRAGAYAGSYSPNGRWIAFRIEDQGKHGLWQMSPDGTHRKLIKRLRFAPGFSDWGTHP